jgi:hypothetical protein
MRQKIKKKEGCVNPSALSPETASDLELRTERSARGGGNPSHTINHGSLALGERVDWGF